MIIEKKARSYAIQNVLINSLFLIIYMVLAWFIYTQINEGKNFILWSILLLLVIAGHIYFYLYRRDNFSCLNCHRICKLIKVDQKDQKEASILGFKPAKIKYHCSRCDIYWNTEETYYFKEK